MKKLLSILIGKIVIIVGKMVNKGSSLPGSLASKIDSKLIYKFKLPKTVIAVTGSSGKGSTTKLIYDVYTKLGFTVAYNSSGSNLKDGILTTLIENSNMFGKIKKDILLVEMDERYAKYVFPAIKPNYVVITNITRDQPPRQGNFDLVFKEIEKAITPDMHLILNADDPYLQKFVLNKKNKVTYFGIEKNKYSTNKTKFENLNLTYCPKCNSKLIYDFYHFENIGSYKCNKCEVSRPNCDYSVKKIDYENNIITLNDNIKIKIPFGMLYAVYNTLAAFTTLAINNLEIKKVEETINNIINQNNSMNCFELGDRLIYTLNNKNENSTTFNQSLLFMERDKQTKTIVIGWKEISRRYKFNDLSWLYDINFELLNKHDIEKVVCVGLQQFDIATRIKLAGIDPKKIVCFKYLEDATYYLNNKTKHNIYAILNFDYVKPFISNMRGEN